MFDRGRPIWRSSILHLVLLAGAVVFALPYAWLVGTSWKLDKELKTPKIRIFPQKPIPARTSPYIDRRQFPEIERPEHVGRERWSAWMQPLLEQEIAVAVGAWSDGRTAQLPRDSWRHELTEGVFSRLLSLLPHMTWREANEADVRAAIRQFLTPELITQCFDQAYRCFAVSEVRLQTLDYRLCNLTAGRPIGEVWTTISGPVELEQRTEPERLVAVAHYDFNKGDRFELTSTFKVVSAGRPVLLADPETGFKHIELSFRSDETWHDMRVLVEMNGKLYRSRSPRYLGNDQWWEVRFQLPGPDDQRLIPRRYILLEQAGEAPEYDHGDDTLRVRVQVLASGQAEACWAKGTENYRRAFDEVPFWRYFKTSVFLVAANVIGTLLSCSLVAYAFARLNWPGRDACFILVLATLMIPPQITMIPSFVIYKYLGWYNTLAPLWVPNALAVNGFGIFLLRQAMKGIPKDLEEAARIDGCGHLRIWWEIMLPLVKPTLAAISIFTFMFVWNDFMGPLIYVNDQRLYPLALGLFSFVIGRENQFTLIMAGSMIMTLPVIITFFLAQRHFIQGVTMSGMKN